LLGVAVFLIGIFPLGQGLLVRSYQKHLEKDCLPSLGRNPAGSCSDPSRFDRVFRWLDRAGPGDVSEAAGEFFFNLSQGSKPGRVSGPVRDRALSLARGHFRECLRRDPFNNVCRTRLAWALWREKDLEGAEGFLRAARSLNPYDSDGLYNLGNFYYYSGKFSQAREIFIQLRGKKGGRANSELEEKLETLNLLLKQELR
jgi:tetratricopeptide (TPR) repeat protein